MKKMSVLAVLSVSLLSAGCTKLDEPGHRLLGVKDADPALYTQVVEPDLYIVQEAPRLYGHDDLSALVVGQSGSRMRTFVIPAALKLKVGDVIKVYLLCYRAEEYGAGELRDAKNECTDVVIPLAPEKK